MGAMWKSFAVGLAAAAFAIVATVVPNTANATFITDGTATDVNTEFLRLNADDKTFFNFVCVSDTDKNECVGLTVAATVDVGTGNVLLTITKGLAVGAGPGGQDVSGFSLAYDVCVDVGGDGTCDPGTDLIIGISAELQGIAGLSAGDIINTALIETAKDDANVLVGSLNVIDALGLAPCPINPQIGDPPCDDPTDPPFETLALGDLELIGAHDLLHILKDVSLFCKDLGGGALDNCTASASIWIQDFEQLKVPEPGTLGLLGIGLAGLGFMMRRRRKTAA